MEVSTPQNKVSMTLFYYIAPLYYVFLERQKGFCKDIHFLPKLKNNTSLIDKINIAIVKIYLPISSFYTFPTIFLAHSSPPSLKL